MKAARKSRVGRWTLGVAFAAGLAIAPVSAMADGGSTQPTPMPELSTVLFLLDALLF